MTSAVQPGAAVVIPCYNQGRFLAAALQSAADQTVPAREILVVDDGSSEDLSQIVRRFPGVRLIRQSNRGLAAARNAGLRKVDSERIIFLDSDDVLRPGAVARGLACFAQHPDAAFVYGAAGQLGAEEGARAYWAVGTHRDLVRCNWIGMIGAVMFDHSKLLSVGGFDESLGMCEDWDAYLRLSRRFPFATHQHLVADYLRHESNMSNDLGRMWTWIRKVRDRELKRGLKGEDLAAWKEGEGVWKALLGPDPKSEPLLARAARMTARVLRGSRP